MSENAWAETDHQLTADDPEAPRVERPAPADLPPPRTKSVRTPGRPRGGGAKPKPRVRKIAEPEPTKYADAINGTFFQLPAGLLLTVSYKTKNVPMMADSLTLAKYGPGIAQAVDEIAQKDARWAAALDRVLTFGPYGALVAAMLPMAAQFATNHGAPEMFGAVSIERLLKESGIEMTSPNGQKDDSPNWQPKS